VNAKEILRHISEHVRNLAGLHGRMRSKGGKNRLQAVAIVLPRKTRQIAGAGVYTALVGRHGNHAVPLAEPGQAFREQIVQLPRR
jgi:hypothetical protein